MSYSIESLLQIAEAGGSVDTVGGSYSKESLVKLARVIGAHGSTLIVGGSYAKESLIEIVKAGHGGKVIVKAKP